MALQLIPVVGEAGMELVEAGANKVGHMSGAMDSSLNLGSTAMDLWNAARPTHPATVNAQQVALAHQQHQQQLKLQQQQYAQQTQGAVSQYPSQQLQTSGSQGGSQALSTPASMAPMLQQNQNMVTQAHNNQLNQSLADMAAVNNQLRSQRMAGFDQLINQEMPFQTQLLYGNLNSTQQPSNSQTGNQSASNSFSRPTQPGQLMMQQLGQPLTQTTNLQAQSTMTHPSNSKINFAQQPAFKMFDNQTINIPKPNNSISYTAMGTPEQHQFMLENPGLIGNFNNNILSPIKEAAINAGTQAAINTGSALAQHSAKKAEELAIRYGQSAMNKATSSLSNFMGKIIGDALPNLTSKPIHMNRITNIRPEVKDAAINALTAHQNKVIGDAPPGSEGEGMMTAEQQDAALNNISNSPLMLLLSEVILQEQMLYNARSLPRNMDANAINRQVIVDKSPVAASFIQEQFTLMSSIRGTATAMNKIYLDTTLIPPNFLGTTSIHMSIVRAAVGVAKVSPPLGGSTLVDSLKGLILGESISAYSSDLRLKTVMTDVDRTLQIFGITANMTSSGSGYSFMLPLLKLLLYAQNRLVVTGEGRSHMSQGFLDVPTPNQAEGGSLYLPFTGRNVVSGNEVLWQARIPNNIKAAVINEKSMIDIFTGNANTGDINNVFHPKNWGNRVAVVFVPITETEMKGKNSTKIAAQFGYPIRTRWHSRTYGFVNRAGNLVFPGVNTDPPNTQNSNHIPHSNNFYIEGPYEAVLFIIIGAADNNERRVSFGFQEDWNLNTEEATIDDPLLIETEAFLVDLARIDQAANLPNISLCIRDWERDFGNNSNRSEALRIIADISRRYFPQTDVLSGLTAGSPLATSSYVPIRTNAEVQVTEGFPDWPEVVLMTSATGDNEFLRYESHMKMATTASGIKPMQIIYHGQVANVRLTRGGDQSYNPVHYHLPRSEALIDYLILRKQMHVAEEYPDESLADLGRTMLTIAVMSNVIAGIVDLVSQANNVSQQLMIAPEVFGVDDTPTKAKMENVMYTAIDRIMTTGIQTPGFYLNLSQQLERRDNFNQDNIASIYGQGYTDGLILNSFARIPRHDLAQFSPSLEVDHNTLALSNANFYPSKNIETINAQPTIMYQILTSPDEMPGISQNEYTSLTNMMSRLSMGQVATAIATNPGLYVRSRTSPILKRVSFTNSNYDVIRSTFISAQLLNNIYIFPPQAANKACPVGQNILTRDPFDGYAPLRLSMAGPADAFLAISYNYYQVQAFTHGSLAYTTTRFQTIPDNVFTGNGLNNALSGF